MDFIVRSGRTFIYSLNKKSKHANNKCKSLVFKAAYQVLFHSVCTYYLMARAVAFTVIMLNCDVSIHALIDGSTLWGKEETVCAIVICGLILSGLILPLYFFVFITPMYIPHIDKRSMVSSRFEFDYAIRLFDMDFLLFVKLMNGKIFWKPFQLHSGIKFKFLRTLAKCPYIWIKRMARFCKLKNAHILRFIYRLTIQAHNRKN